MSIGTLILFAQANTTIAEQHGCQPILANFPTKWPLGLDVIKAQFAAIKEHRLFAFQGPVRTCQSGAFQFLREESSDLSCSS